MGVDTRAANCTEGGFFFLQCIPRPKTKIGKQSQKIEKRRKWGKPGKFERKNWLRIAKKLTENSQEYQKICKLTTKKWEKGEKMARNRKNEITKK